MRYDDEVHKDIAFVPKEQLDTLHHLVASPSGLGACSLHEYRRDTIIEDETTPTPKGDAMMAVLMLKSSPRHKGWVNGRQSIVEESHAGQVRLFDLRDSYVDEVPFAFHSVHLFMPNAAFTKKENVSPDWQAESNLFNDDQVLHHLIQSLMPALTAQASRDQLFCDLVLHAASRHIAQTYANLVPTDPGRGGALSQDQARPAKEFLMSRISGDISLEAVAAECGLSPDHFGRAFRQIAGLPPYRWLTHQRIERSKVLLRESGDSLVSIALTCGFANQSHFTRTFTKIVGVSPGEWRHRSRF